MFTLWGVLQHLTAKFHLKTKFVLHLNQAFPMFKKQNKKTHTKKIEVEKNIT